MKKILNTQFIKRTGGTLLFFIGLLLLERAINVTNGYLLAIIAVPVVLISGYALISSLISLLRREPNIPNWLYMPVIAVPDSLTTHQHFSGALAHKVRKKHTFTFNSAK